jgi:hypothetical protein
MAPTADTRAGSQSRLRERSALRHVIVRPARSGDVRIHGLVPRDLIPGAVALMPAGVLGLESEFLVEGRVLIIDAAVGTPETGDGGHLGVGQLEVE